MLLFDCDFAGRMETLWSFHAFALSIATNARRRYQNPRDNAVDSLYRPPPTPVPGYLKLMQPLYFPGRASTTRSFHAALHALFCQLRNFVWA